eukprot:9022226-Prorocentrum_lima.AAC.1
MERKSKDTHHNSNFSCHLGQGHRSTVKGLWTAWQQQAKGTQQQSTLESQAGNNSTREPTWHLTREPLKAHKPH